MATTVHGSAGHRCFTVWSVPLRIKNRDLLTSPPAALAFMEGPYWNLL